MSVPLRSELHFVAVSQDDPLAAPLIDELAVEYAGRYGGRRDRVHAWLRGYPADEFAPPDGALMVGLLDGRPVTGGAFRRFDDTTAELKRIWTDSGNRRRGYGRALVSRLEDAIAAAGYTSVYLTTGDRQPEAEALYLAMGYARLAEPLPAEGEVYPIAFLKELRWAAHCTSPSHWRVTAGIRRRGGTVPAPRRSPVAGTGENWR